MEINDIVREAHDVAEQFGLELIEVDRTDNTISLKLVVDTEILISIYGNTQKHKLNLALILKQRRLYGYDSEGGTYHCHPSENPESHVAVADKRTILDFVKESLSILETRHLL